MTTITIQIPDSQNSDLIEAIKSLTQKAGLTISIDDDDDNLSENEFASLKEGLKEAMLIKKGVIKGTPASELWND